MKHFKVSDTTTGVTYQSASAEAVVVFLLGAVIYCLALGGSARAAAISPASPPTLVAIGVTVLKQDTTRVSN